jgi:hypothetical protein
MDNGDGDPVLIVDHAVRVISDLNSEDPLNTDYQDAYICASLLREDQKPAEEVDVLESLYATARTLKELKEKPCLQWRHTGTASRSIVKWHLSRGDSYGASSWIEVARRETRDYLTRPDRIPEDRRDWMEFLLLEGELRFRQGNVPMSWQCRTEWGRELSILAKTYPERPSIQQLEQNESNNFYYLVNEPKTIPSWEALLPSTDEYQRPSIGQ